MIQILFDIMSYKRKIDLISMQEQFRDYLISKNPRSRRILETYDHSTKGRDIHFGINDHYVYIFEDETRFEQFFPGSTGRQFTLSASKDKGDFAKVVLDTGSFLISEKGEINPCAVFFDPHNRGRSRYNLFDDLDKGIEGLGIIKTEAEIAIDIYKKIFPPRGKRKKQII